MTLFIVASCVGCVMSHVVSLLDGRRALSLACASVTFALLAGCSADSSRMGDPFGNPFGSSARMSSVDRQPTASTQDNGYANTNTSGYQSAPVGRVASQGLPPIQSSPIAPVRGAGLSQTYATAPHPSPVRVSAAGTGGLGARAGYDIPTATTVNHAGTAASAHGAWSAAGGTPIVVAQGESAALLGQRYGVPVDSLLRVNGFSSASQVQPGARMVIPVYSANSGTRTAAVEPPAPVAAAPVRTAHVRPVSTPVRTVEAAPARLGTQPSSHEKFAFQKGPEAAPLRKGATDKVGNLDRKTSKVVSDARAQTRSEATAKVAPAKAVSEKIAAAKVVPVKVAKVEAAPVVAAKPPRVAAVSTARTDATPTASTSDPAVVQPAAATSPDAAAPEFRWPARGRIIQGFKTGGNDGINIAVPEGTSVKAAESGVVAYAGNELKGYGNLVLIRHPNGFVSAYANNGEIDVKRGDTVKRGQTIAKSGQTGNVASPQLHFELRKGQTPVDPTQFLAGL